MVPYSKANCITTVACTCGATGCPSACQRSSSMLSSDPDVEHLTVPVRNNKGKNYKDFISSKINNRKKRR